MSDGPRRERKVISVVFTDLVGFTARSETLDPEDVEAFLGPYHALVRRELERFGGTVEKFIGDAVVGIFGAPAAHEDDAERAVRAALAVRDAVVERGEIEVRIAINTGEAIVRLDHDPARGEGFATGDVLNTAARLQAAAPVNQVLVGPATFQATRDVIAYEAVEPVAAKGKSEPVPAWRATEARSRFGVDVRQGSTLPLVGRERERTLLIDALERAEQEQTPQLVTLVGVPGIGKSRLVFELFEELERRPDLRTWRQGRSLPYGEGVSYWALSEMVKAQAGILEGDAAALAGEKVARAAAEMVPPDEVDWVAGWLRALVGLDPPPGSGAERRDEAFTAWRRFLEGLAERRPLVLVFEDIHWADDGLLDFIDHLVDWASGVPILVLATTRPELLERRPAWAGGKRNALTLALSPLSDTDSDRLLHAVFGATTLPDTVRSTLLERASGNPLYAQQFARLYAERGEIGDGPLPETVHGLIAARIDALSREEKALLQDAAVMGKVFWTGALQAAGSTALLQGLQRKEFIRRERRTSVASDEEFAFCHVLVRDVAYSQIPRAERAAKHRRAAEWIEALGRPQDHAELLAHHYGAALELTPGEPDPTLVDRARRAWAEAGDRAFALNAAKTASDAYRQALALTDPGASERPGLVRRLATAEYRLTGDAVERLQEAVEALEHASEIESAAEAEVLLVRNLWDLGRPGELDRHLDHAHGLVTDRPPSAARALVLATRARYVFLSGNATEARGSAEEALELATRLGLEELRADVLNTLGMIRHSSNEPGAIEQLRESIAIHESLNSIEAFRGWNNIGTLLYMAGRLSENEASDAEAARVAARFGNATDIRWSAHVTAAWPFFHGEWDETLRRVEPLIAEAEAGRPHYLSGTVYFLRARIRAARGDDEGAVADAEQGLALDRRNRDPQSFIPGLALSTVVRVEVGDTHGAMETFGELNRIRRETARHFPFGAGAAIVDAAIRLGQGEAFMEAVLDLWRTPWRDAAEGLVAGDFAGASAVYERIGAEPDLALTRLRWAQSLAAAGSRDRAAEVVGPARDYYSRARADRYLAQLQGLPD